MEIKLKIWSEVFRQSALAVGTENCALVDVVMDDGVNGANTKITPLSCEWSQHYGGVWEAVSQLTKQPPEDEYNTGGPFEVCRQQIGIGGQRVPLDGTAFCQGNALNRNECTLTPVTQVPDSAPGGQVSATVVFDVTDALWHQAWMWLCRRRQKAPPGADIWHLRYHRAQELPRLIRAAENGTYRLSPMQVVRRSHGQENLLQWSAGDALVLKWVSLQIQSRLPLSPRCTHIAGHRGGRSGLHAITRCLQEGHRFVYPDGYPGVLPAYL